jgi:hypothetical protein
MPKGDDRCSAGGVLQFDCIRFATVVDGDNRANRAPGEAMAFGLAVAQHAHYGVFGD